MILINSPIWYYSWIPGIMFSISYSKIRWLLISLVSPRGQPNENCQSDLTFGICLGYSLTYLYILQTWEDEAFGCTWWWWFSCSVMLDSSTAWAIACRAPLFTAFPRQEDWSGFPFPAPGVGPVSPALQADSLPLSYQRRLGGAFK